MNNHPCFPGKEYAMCNIRRKFHRTTTESHEPLHNRHSIELLYRNNYIYGTSSYPSVSTQSGGMSLLLEFPPLWLNGAEIRNQAWLIDAPSVDS